MLIVWSDDLDHIIPLCNDFEEKLMKLVWRSRPTLTTFSDATSFSASTTGSNVNLYTKAKDAAAVASEAVAALAQKEKPRPESKWNWSWKSSPPRKSSTRVEIDVEKAPAGREARPIRLFAPIYGGLGTGLSLCMYIILCICPRSHDVAVFIASGVSLLLQEWRLDKDYTRFALLFTIPFLLCVSLVCLLVTEASGLTD